MVGKKESQYVKKLLNKIYFTSPQLPLFGEPKKYYLEDVVNKEGKLLYLREETKIICEPSLALYFGDKLIGEYSSKKIGKNLRYFKNKVESLIENNKPQVGVLFLINGESVTIEEMIEKEMKSLANKLFKN